MVPDAIEERDERPVDSRSKWPEEFASRRESGLALFCAVTWGGILAVLAAGNNLLPLKQALVVLAGARLQPLLSSQSVHSMDIAAVLFGAMLVVVGGYVHVSVGLAVVLALRPWLDGFTYPADNTYFLWAIFYLMALWGLRQYRNPKPFRGGLPLLLLGLYMLYGALGLVTSIQPGSTYTELFLWLGYGALLLTVMNSTDSPQARGVVLFGVVLGVSGQALFAYPHLAYVLPWLRHQLQTNPEMLALWFQGATEFTPELARRFNLNRAFGSMVFPNALAALMVLGIPVTFAIAVDGWRDLLRNPSKRPHVAPGGYLSLIGLGVPLFAALALIVYAMGLLGLVYQLDAPPFFGDGANLRLLSVGIAGPTTLAFLLVGRAGGLSRGLCFLKTIGASVMAPVMIGALWLSYSRGGMLALAVAVVVGFVWPWARPGLGEKLSRLRFRRKLVGFILLVILVLAAGVVENTAGADTADERPGTVVLQEGMDLSMADLANPASFAARLGYWRVALRVAADHLVLGVGLGNFGIAYGPEQDIAAGDVRNAHSVVLQNLCEVGLPGLVLFAAFWIVMLWRGVEALRRGRLVDNFITWAMLVGILAFLLHAVIDINFSHPSLVMMAMALLGLFYQEASSSPKPVSRQALRGGALALMVAATLVSGLCMRPYFQALGLNGGRFINVSQRNWLGTRQQAAVFFLSDGPNWALGGKVATPPRIPVATATSLFPEREMLATLGRIVVPDPIQKVWLEVSPEQPLPANSVLELQRPWDAQFYTVDRLERWTAELIYLDSRFPHDADLALTISRVYRLLYDFAQAKQADRKKDYLAGMLRWSDVAVARSPLHKDMYQHRAWVKWTDAGQRKGQASLDGYMSAIDDFQRSQTLGHLEPAYYFAHAGALSALAQSYANQGVVAEAEAFRQKADGVRKAGIQLQEARWARGLQ